MSSFKKNSNKKKRISDYTPTEQKQMRKELMLILRKCANGTANEQEKHIGEKIKIYPDGRNRPLSIANNTNEKKDTVWTALALKYKFPEFQESEKHSIPFYQAKERHSPGIWLCRYGSIAALFVLIMGTALYFSLNRTVSGKKLYQTTAQMEENILPDGTDIHLNQDSKLEVLKGFNQKMREVSMQGQIFFDVAKDPDKPFIIRHGALRTKVCGTSFDIKSYPGLNENVVTVRTGRVEVSLNKKLLTVLTPGKQLRYNVNTGKYEIRKINWNKTVGWMDGRIILNNANINELKMQIKQHFNKELIVRNQPFDGDVRLYTSFKQGATLKQVMERLCILYGIKYTTDSSRVVVYR